MPLYDYHCKKCGKNFEIQHKMAESAPAIGPDCAESLCSLQKQISPVAASVRSPNPFVSQSGRPVAGGANLQAGGGREVGKKEEKAHTCSTGCAMHSR